jgi:hypothetical protein
VTIAAGPEVLAARLDATDVIVATLRTVPREHFLPARIWVQETDDGPYKPIDQAGRGDAGRVHGTARPETTGRILVRTAVG